MSTSNLKGDTKGPEERRTDRIPAARPNPRREEESRGQNPAKGEGAKPRRSSTQSRKNKHERKQGEKTKPKEEAGNPARATTKKRGREQKTPRRPPAKTGTPMSRTQVEGTAQRTPSHVHIRVPKEYQRKKKPLIPMGRPGGRKTGCATPSKVRGQGVPDSCPTGAIQG